MQKQRTLRKIAFGDTIYGPSRRCPLAINERIHHERELALGVKTVDREARCFDPSQRLLRSVLVCNYAERRREGRGLFDLGKRGKCLALAGRCRNECLSQRRLWRHLY